MRQSLIAYGQEVGRQGVAKLLSPFVTLEDVMKLEVMTMLIKVGIIFKNFIHHSMEWEYWNFAIVRFR